MSAVLISAAEDVASHLCCSGSPHSLLAPPSGLFYVLIQIHHKGLEIINIDTYTQMNSMQFLLGALNNNDETRKVLLKDLLPLSH